MSEKTDKTQEESEERQQKLKQRSTDSTPGESVTTKRSTCNLTSPLKPALIKNNNEVKVENLGLKKGTDVKKLEKLVDKQADALEQLISVDILFGKAPNDKQKNIGSKSTEHKLEPVPERQNNSNKALTPILPLTPARTNWDNQEPVNQPQSQFNQPPIQQQQYGQQQFVFPPAQQIIFYDPKTKQYFVPANYQFQQVISTVPTTTSVYPQKRYTGQTPPVVTIRHRSNSCQPNQSLESGSEALKRLGNAQPIAFSNPQKQQPCQQLGYPQGQLQNQKHSSSAGAPVLIPHKSKPSKRRKSTSTEVNRQPVPTTKNVPQFRQETSSNVAQSKQLSTAQSSQAKKSLAALNKKKDKSKVLRKKSADR